MVDIFLIWLYSEGRGSSSNYCPTQDNHILPLGQVPLKYYSLPQYNYFIPSKSFHYNEILFCSLKIQQLIIIWT